MKDKKTMWIVIAIVVAILGIGIGIMCSGSDPEIKTITVPEAPTYVMDSAGNFVVDTTAVDSTVE